METHEPLFGRLVGRLPVGSLVPVAPFLLIGLRKVTGHVFSFVPLLALDLGSLSECRSDVLAHGLAATNDAENTLLFNLVLSDAGSYTQRGHSRKQYLPDIRAINRKQNHQEIQL